MYGIYHKICLFLTFFILISIIFLPFVQAEKSLTEISKEKIQEDYSETYKPRPYNIRFISGQFTPNPLAKEMIMTGEMISAEEALHINLVSKVVPHDRLIEECVEMAEKIAAMPTFAVQFAKQTVNREFGGEEMTYVTEAPLYLMFSEDAKEGVSAFREKRKPEYKGR